MVKSYFQYYKKSTEAEDVTNGHLVTIQNIRNFIDLHNLLMGTNLDQTNEVDVKKSILFGFKFCILSIIANKNEVAMSKEEILGMLNRFPKTTFENYCYTHRVLRDFAREISSVNRVTRPNGES
jgi:hypothetical protein